MKQHDLIDYLKAVKEITVDHIAVEVAESKVIETGKDLAALVLAIPHGIDPRTRAQAQLFLRRHKAAQKTRLAFTIDKATKAAKQIDRMVPDAPKE